VVKGASRGRLWCRQDKIKGQKSLEPATCFPLPFARVQLTTRIKNIETKSGCRTIKFASRCRSLLPLRLRIEKVVHHREIVVMRFISVTCVVSGKLPISTPSAAAYAMDSAALQPEHFRDVIGRNVGIAWMKNIGALVV